MSTLDKTTRADEKEEKENKFNIRIVFESTRASSPTCHSYAAGGLTHHLRYQTLYPIYKVGFAQDIS
jgi:hypothetical protein